MQLGRKNKLFLLAGHKVDFISPYWAKNPFFPCRTRFFSTKGHKMDLFVPNGEIKSTL